MRKFITLIAVVISLAGQAQVKDSVSQDTVYVLSKAQMQVVQRLFLQNSLQFDGKPIAAGDVIALLNDLMKNPRLITVPKKEQPK